MDSIANLLRAISDILAPVFDFLVWTFPIKIYRLHDGERGVIKTYGKVRSWRIPERNAGVTICFVFEEMEVVQALGGYINFDFQTIKTKDNQVVTINAAVQYEIFSVKQAILETDGIEDVLSGVCMNELREFAQTNTFEDIFNSDKLTDKLASRVNRKIKHNGARIERLMITDLRPHEITMICNTVKDVSGGIKIKIDQEK